MAKPKVSTPESVFACDMPEPDLNAEAKYLEGKPHGGYDWRGHSDSTRDGLERDNDMEAGGREESGESHELAPPYTHHLNPEQMHARSIASDPAGRATGASSLDDGLQFREPLRADLDDAMK